MDEMTKQICKDYDKEIAELKERCDLIAGWWYAEACSNLDAGDDMRFIEFPEIVERMNIDLGVVKE